MPKQSGELESYLFKLREEGLEYAVTEYFDLTEISKADKKLALLSQTAKDAIEGLSAYLEKRYDIPY